MGELVITENELKNGVVVQRNELIEAAYHMEATEKRILNTFISQLDSVNKENPRQMTLSIAEFNKFYNITNSRDYLPQAIHRLQTKLVRLRGKFKIAGMTFTEKAFPIVSTSLSSSTHIVVVFHEDAMPLLEKLKGTYTKYALAETVRLKSIYAIRFYELFQEQITYRKRTFLISELREMFELEKKYKSTQDFFRRVIEKPIEEINKNTSLQVRIEQVKDGRKIIGYKFYFKETGEAKYQKAGAAIEKFLTQGKKICCGGWSFGALAAENDAGELEAWGMNNSKRNFRKLLKENNYKWEVVK